MKRRAPAPAPAPAKRGRPKKPAVPGSTPNGSGLPADITTAQAMGAELDRVRQRAASGARLANHESRILRDAWLIDMSQHLWPSMESAAADLGVSVTTVRSYAGDGCPGLDGHGSPIPKAAVLAWLLKRAHERGGTAPATTASIEAVELSIKQAKDAKLWGTLIAEAEDRARQGVIETVDSLKHQLLQVLPAQLANATREAPDAQAAEDATRDLLDAALRACAYQPPRSVTTTEPHREPA